MLPRLLFVLISASLMLTEPTPGLAQASTEKVVSLPTRTTAEASNPTGLQVLFKPSGGGKPPTTRGAGSRSNRLCAQDARTVSDPSATAPVLTALVPGDQFGLTWAERPTFWVYLPQTSARQIVLSIKTEDSRPHSQRFLPINGESGIIEIPLDKSAPSLEIGKSYRWAIVLVCGDRPSPNDPFVTAWVRRVIPSKPFSNQPSALDRVVQYGAQGVWYDAVTTLATMRRSQPTDPTLTEIWTEFLLQPTVGLGAIANEPLR